MRPLTDRQRQVLEILIRTTEEGCQATIQEICDELGLLSKQATHEHMRALSWAGYIALANKSRRGCRVLKNPDGSDFLPVQAKYAVLCQALGCPEGRFEDVLAVARARRAA